MHYINTSYTADEGKDCKPHAFRSLFWTHHRNKQKGDSNMGVNTDGQDVGPGSTLTDGVKDTEKSGEFEQETENEKNLPQDADGDVGIQDQKTAKETGIPLITTFQSMPSQHTSSALNTERDEAQMEHTNGGDGELSNTLVNVTTDTSADDKCVKLGECSSSLQPVEILETDTNDAWYAKCIKLNEISLNDASVFKQDLSFNPDIDLIGEEGYMAKGNGIPLITTLQNILSRHNFGALNTKHNNAQIEQAEGGYGVLSNNPTLLRSDADKEDEKTELSHGALVNLNTDISADDKCLKLEECTSSLQPAKIMNILETDTNDDWDAMYDTLLDEKSLSDAIAFKLDVEDVNDLISRGANINKPSKGGLRPLHEAAQEVSVKKKKTKKKYKKKKKKNKKAKEEEEEEEEKVIQMNEADTQQRTDQLATHVINAKGENDCTQADNARRGADELSLKNLPTMTHNVEHDVGRPNVNEHLSPLRGDPNEEDTEDSLSGEHPYSVKNLATKGNVKKKRRRKKKVVTIKETDTQSHTGQLASHADNSERGADELSLKNVPTKTHGDEIRANGESKPFTQPKLKYPEKAEQDPMLDQMKVIKCIGTRTRDTATNGTDWHFPHAPQTWQCSGFDPPSLQTTETDHHPSEEMEFKCHSLIDENKQMRHSKNDILYDVIDFPRQEPSSSMNAANDLPIKETSVKFESFPTNPSAVVHQQLNDGNPVSTHGTSSNPVRKIRMIITLAIILAGSTVLVAGSDSIERVTLQAGKPGVVSFRLTISLSNTSQIVPFYTFRFKSKSRPFCINGNADIVGFKSPSQLSRFTTSVTDLDTSPRVNLMIEDVDTIDEDGYVLTAVWHSFEDVRYETMKKEIVVQIPPGPAKCFITLSENVDYPYEVHCRATTGSVATSLSCYQNDRMIDVTSDITDNGLITKGIFWLPDDTHFSCCSHDVTSYVSQTFCNDFVWSHNKETTRQAVITVPKSISSPTPQVESHEESGACTQYRLPSLWHFTYLFVNLLAFATIY